MAQYEITYKCGHTETVQLYGPNKDRERKIAAMESHVCPACRAAEVNANTEMATLKGSDKQIGWASDIRNRMLENVERYRTKMMNYGKKFDAPEEQLVGVNNTLDQVADYIKAETSAKWFIDNRYETEDNLVNAVAVRIQGVK